MGLSYIRPIVYSLAEVCDSIVCMLDCGARKRTHIVRTRRGS